jgi:hypothetical protein
MTDLSLAGTLVDALVASVLSNVELVVLGGSVAAVLFGLGLVLQIVVAATQESLP